MKKPKILIAYDDSDCSEHSLQDLKRAGMPDEAEACVFTVADTWAGEGGLPFDSLMNPQWAVFLKAHQDDIKASLQDAARVAGKAAAKLKGSFPGWKITVETAADLPVWKVMEKIGVWNPDLVVMGSHGRSAVGRLLFGSVSHRVLTQTHCNLRISRPESVQRRGTEEPLRVLVAFDGSEESEIAFRTALCRDWPKDTLIKIVTVIDPRVSMAFIRPTGPIRYWIKNDDTDPIAWIDRMFADQKWHIKEKGFLADAEALTGDPKRLLLQEAESWRADCIFTGSRGLTGRERVVSGSVSTALAMHAHCPVEVVHRLWTAHACCDAAREKHRECMSKN